MPHYPEQSEATIAGVDRQSLARIGRELERELRKTPSPSAQADVALVRLSAGKPTEAVILLEAAASADSPEKAWFLNDLAVAYLARSDALDQPRDVVRALESAALAAEIEPAMSEACFNRALALERLHLVGQASAAWQDCATLESDPAWKDDIDRHLERLGQRPSSKSLEEALRSGDPGEIEKAAVSDLQAARTEALEILSEWGDAFLSGREADAATAAAQGQLLGRILSDRSRDFTIANVFEAITRETGRSPGRSRLTALAKAAQLYQDAQSAVTSYKCDVGGPLFEEARALFAQAGSSMEPWAELGAVGCAFYADRFDEVLARLQGMRFDAPRFPVLAARWHWIKGMAHSRQGDLRASLREFEATLANFEGTGERENQGAGYQLVGEMYRLLGDEDEAWRYRIRGLTLFREIPESRRRLMLLRDAGESLLAEGRSRAASAFLGEAVQIASSSANVRDYAEMLLWNARALTQLGRFEEAWADLQRAREKAAEVQDSNLRERALADIGFAEADLESQRRPDRALPLFEEPYASYQRKGHVLPQVTLLLHRARLARSLKRPDLELADLDEGIALFERQWLPLDRDKDRVSFLETAQELYDARILREIEGGDPTAALEYSERSRAFWTGAPGAVDASWVRRLAVRSGKESPCAGAEGELLPANVVVLEYALIGDRVFLWQLHCNTARFLVAPVSVSSLKNLVRNFRRVAQSGSPERFHELAEKAHDILIRPVLQDLPPGVALVVVPDKDLHGIPFGALRDRATGRFLLEDYEVAISPSATFFRTALRAPKTFVDIEDALLVSPLNPDLRESRREIEELRRLYPKSEVLDGLGAGRDTILASLDEHWLFHYAGHAVIYPDNPFQSYLPLAPDGTEEITLSDLQGRSFEYLDLVVLSACSSVGATPVRGGGFLGLARPFLSGGVRSVVGTLWDVDDIASRAIIIKFHHHIGAGYSPVASLRLAQLESIREGGLPSAWAAFEVLGA